MKILNYIFSFFQTGAASRCWRRYPSGSGNGTENCLTLDIYTPSVVYDQLLPVVVYVDGDDLSEEDDETIRPSAGWFILPINVNAPAPCFPLINLFYIRTL